MDANILPLSNQKSQNKKITQNRLKELLSYDPETGIFIWLVASSNRVHKGMIAGRDNGNGYRRIMVDRKVYYAHHLAWLFVYGELPKQEMDHIDGVRSNNRISNLRCGVHAQNMQNLSLRDTNTSGMTGVSWLRSYGKWEAYITVNYKKINLGYYDNVDEAGAAYSKAKREMHRFQPTLREGATCYRG